MTVQELATLWKTDEIGVFKQAFEAYYGELRMIAVDYDVAHYMIYRDCPAYVRHFLRSPHYFLA